MYECACGVFQRRAADRRLAQVDARPTDEKSLRGLRRIPDFGIRLSSECFPRNGINIVAEVGQYLDETRGALFSSSLLRDLRYSVGELFLVAIEERTVLSDTLMGRHDATSTLGC
jgi:hypothetical protein